MEPPLQAGILLSCLSAITSTLARLVHADLANPARVRSSLRALTFPPVVPCNLWVFPTVCAQCPETCKSATRHTLPRLASCPFTDTALLVAQKTPSLRRRVFHAVSTSLFSFGTYGTFTSALDYFNVVPSPDLPECLPLNSIGRTTGQTPRRKNT